MSRIRVLALGWGFSALLALAVTIASSPTTVHVLGGLATAGALALGGYYWRRG